MKTLVFIPKVTGELVQEYIEQIEIEEDGFPEDEENREGLESQRRFLYGY